MSQDEAAKLKNERDIFELKKLKFEILEKEHRDREALPHLYRYKHYKWSRLVFESTNREIFLVAANQLSKSSTAIRKNIEWATNKSLWPKLWPGKTPNLFWYFYPNFSLATTEFETKWQEFLPKDKEDPVYGWKPYYDKGLIQKIVFKSGIILMFRAYSQKLIDIQAASVYMVTADEEMPIILLPEISARTNATDGYFMMVFTATLGQAHWKETMEPTSKASEKHPDALKMCIALYDSMEYEDGSPSPWTEEKIARAKRNCPTEAEVQRRVYGRFVKSEGLEYEGFAVDRNMSDPHKYPPTWQRYISVDPGTGGSSGHPAAILHLLVNPQATQGRVVRAWRGDGIPTTSQDILERHKLMRIGIAPHMQIYDYAAKDFFMIASRQGEAFTPADKTKGMGVGLINMLFKSKMLMLHRGEPEIDKLVTELCSLSIGEDKRKAKDDLVDALRYAVMAVPWDFSALEIPEELKEAVAVLPKKTEGQTRREWFFEAADAPTGVEGELDEWNDLVGNH